MVSMYTLLGNGYSLERFSASKGPVRFTEAFAVGAPSNFVPGSEDANTESFDISRGILLRLLAIFVSHPGLAEELRPNER